MTTSFRVRFAGQQGVAGPGSSKERRIPSQKTLSFKEGQDSMRISEIPDEKTPAKVVGPTPSMKRTPTFTEKPAVPMKKIPTFAEEQLRRTDEIQPESLKPKTDMPATTKPPVSPAKFDKQTPTRPGIRGREADAWEKAELAKINKKYEELEARILSWEHKKKAKSRRRLDRIESELEKKRLKALQQFRSEGDDINEIAGGARSKAMESKRNEELKVKEKANKIGVTGRVPRTCFCF
ncbi:hypothetical protein GH714_030212 [Hevea brasiliensis]|uniref:Remorin C-terminal domain-containing protein n=1 Tax=Hevea brasiliensis TaxID=3981 RepID=A0A6A6LKF0_HEVBR|nr:hypothetical protein GH714_030212 [Hevea brasiliensis]